MYLENMLIQFPSNIQFGDVTSLLQEMIKIKIMRTWRYVLVFFKPQVNQKQCRAPHQDINQQLSKQKIGNNWLKRVFFRKNI